MDYITYKTDLTHWGGVTHIYIGKTNHHWFTLWLVAWTAPSHYLKQYCIIFLIFHWKHHNKFRWQFNRNSNIFIEENTFENVGCEMFSISSQPQCWLHEPFFSGLRALVLFILLGFDLLWMITMHCNESFSNLLLLNLNGTRHVFNELGPILARLTDWLHSVFPVDADALQKKWREKKYLWWLLHYGT